ncbi:MAG TPA: hypothetical protein VHZ78_00175 [Rhizomicrobium sp.]|jgi:hypothetical protein|nr:hypothetical protein [Rhizomicrobium sp.]
MRHLRILLPVVATAFCALLIGAAPTPPAAPYVPKAVFCYPVPHGPVLPGPLCSRLPGNIGPDPILDVPTAYNGIGGSLPTSANNDAQTPFDNLSWQTFVALNWTAGKQDRLPAEGLAGNGRRVWQSWSRVSSVFGNSSIQANCHVPLGMQTFSIGSHANNTPAPQNEEYIQAATGDPAIDVNGNWTIYERRVNNIEIAYLKAPGGNAAWNLTTTGGQQAFIAASQTVNFPAVGAAPNGAMEIKAAWRILDPAKHAANAKRFFIIKAMLAVAPNLVAPVSGKAAAPICAPVELGLVAMHIIQKNPLTKNNLKPEWFWSTFEQVDNAPLSPKPCNPSFPTACGTLENENCGAAVPANPPDYSYFNTSFPTVPTNQPPVALKTNPNFTWNPTQPFAKNYLTGVTVPGGTRQIGTQISRCWAIYALTQDLNTQWRDQLRKIGSVFANYMLVGTQWGGVITNTPSPQVPNSVVPPYLSNSVIETYLQTAYAPPGQTQNQRFGTGSCVTCHGAATLYDNKTPSDLSFLPSLAVSTLVRRAPLPPDAPKPK